VVLIAPPIALFLVAFFQQIDEHRLAFRALHVDRDRALVAVQHGEIKTVGIRHVAQLAARRITLRRLELDHVRAHPRQQLRACRARLHVGHVENTNTLQSFHSDLQKFCGRCKAARLLRSSQ
jgi:hypothetical protein